MVSRFSPSKFNHSNTDDCCKIPIEREGMIADQAAKETIIVCLKENKQIANFFLPMEFGGRGGFEMHIY